MEQGSQYVHHFEIHSAAPGLQAGDTPGYEIRFLLEESPAPGMKPPKWGPWLFVTEENAVAIADNMKDHFATQGHLKARVQ